MQILKNYVFRMWLASFLLAIMVLTFILVMGNFVQLAELVITKGVQLGPVIKLFLYLVPYLLVFAIPMAVLTSSLLIFNRLSFDNEITAMRASGISLLRVVTPIILSAIMLSLICLHLNDTVIPRAHFLSRKTVADIGLNKPTAALEPKTFIKSFTGYVIFIYEIKDKKLYNLRIYQPQPDKPTRTIIAKQGEFIPLKEQKQLKLKLISGTIDQPGEQDNFYKLNFDNYYMILDLAQGTDPNKLEKKMSDYTMDELNSEVAAFKKAGIDVFPLLTQLHKRIAISFSSIIFALIGIPLGIKTRRREFSISFGISLVVIVLYYLMLISAEVLALKQIYSAAIIMWLPNVIFFILGLKLSQDALKK